MDKENTGYQVILHYFGKKHISRKYAEECDYNSTVQNYVLVEKNLLKLGRMYVVIYGLLLQIVLT